MAGKTVPTIQESIHIDGFNFHFVPAPHLIYLDNWHTAYKKRIIREIYNFVVTPRNDSTPLPDYPVRSDICNERDFDRLDFVFECGAYWEGAIYYLRRSLNQQNLLEGIDKVISSEVENLPNILWKIFAHIWNRYDQLKWLKAFLVRRDYGSDIPEGLEAGYVVIERVLADPQVPEPVKWLTTFVHDHPKDEHQYPNPFYGGYNPLHLDIDILTSD